MAVTEGTDSSFTSDVDPDGVTVVDFWAPWCGPCRAFAPIFEKSANDNPKIAHLKVNVDENPHLSEYFAISAIPTLVVLRQGYVLSAIAGAQTGSGLASILEEAESLDMDAIKAAAQD